MIEQTQTSDEALKDAFHQEMLNLYKAATRLKPPIHASRFLSMVTEHGGLDTAERLLASKQPSSGFTELLFRGNDKLRLSVEYLVLLKPWRQLFTPDQLAIARSRLREVECELPPDDAVE